MLRALILLASFVVHLSLISALPPLSTLSFVQPPRATLAFVDNNKRNNFDQSTEKHKRSMSSASLDEMSDADAYHEMISAAVDLTNVHVRNGILSGKSTVANATWTFKLISLSHSLSTTVVFRSNSIRSRYRY